MLGVCTANAAVPTSTCPFEDDVVVNGQTLFSNYVLPSTQMSCEAASVYFKNTYDGFACDQPNFLKACCNYCKSKFIL